MLDINNDVFLDVVFDAVKLMVPVEELKDEQLQILEDIYIIWEGNGEFDGDIEKDAAQVRIFDDPESNPIIHLNEKFFMKDLLKKEASFFTFTHAFLLFLIRTIMHEIIHLIFQTRDEEWTKEKTDEWLNLYDWKDTVPQPLF